MNRKGRLLKLRLSCILKAPCFDSFPLKNVLISAYFVTSAPLIIHENCTRRSSKLRSTQLRLVTNQGLSVGLVVAFLRRLPLLYVVVLQ